MNQLMLELDEGNWQRTYDYDKSVVALADRHYSRQKVGTNRATRPGKNLVLRTGDGMACWASWFPKYRDDGQTAAAECTIFRNESDISTVALLREAVEKTFEEMSEEQDGILTYIDESKVKSKNAGYSYKLVGFKATGYSKKSKLLRLQLNRGDYKRNKNNQLIIDGQLRGLYEQLQLKLKDIQEYFDMEVDFVNEWILEPVNGEANYVLINKLNTVTAFDSYYDWQEEVSEILKIVILYRVLTECQKQLNRKLDFTKEKLDVMRQIPILDIAKINVRVAAIEILQEFYAGWIPSEEFESWATWIEQVQCEVKSMVKTFIKNIG